MSVTDLETISDLRQQLAASQQELEKVIGQAGLLRIDLEASQKRIAELEGERDESRKLHKECAGLYEIQFQRLESSLSASHRQREELEAACAAMRGVIQRFADYIFHASGCNTRFYGKDRDCNCGFWDFRKSINAALASNAGKELAERIRLLEVLFSDVKAMLDAPADSEEETGAVNRLLDHRAALDAAKPKEQ